MSAERFPSSIPISYNTSSSSSSSLSSGFQVFQTYIKYFEECVETLLGPVKQ